MKSGKVTQFPVAALWVALLLVAVITRFYDIANKPIHFDESINGWFVIQMAKVGFYKYDPTNYHGPLYFYLLQFVEMIRGRSLQTLRTVPALFSVLSVMVFTLGFSLSGSVQRWMAFFILASPAFLFFGRSGIHEMSFVFFQIVFALAVLRWLEKSDSRALALAMVGIWGMVTLKETFVITLLCWVMAIVSLGPTQMRIYFTRQRLANAWSPWLSGLALVLIVLFVAMFTGFFKYGVGLIDFVKAFLPWLKTGVQGLGHEKPLSYWIDVLWQAEPLALLGVLFSLAGVFSGQKVLRIVSVFSLTQLLVYSLIPYKTVWCLLSLVWGFYLVLALVLVRMREIPIFIRMLLLTTGSVFFGLGVQSAYLSVFRHPISFEHPYVYVNSTEELKVLQDYLIEMAQKNPQIANEPVQIGMQEHWPWPWVLSDFKNLHYDLCGKRIIENAAVYLCELPEIPFVDVLLHEPYWKIQLSLRQSREPSVIYLKKALFPNVPFKKNVSTADQDEVVK